MTDITDVERLTYEAVEEIQGIKHDNGQFPDYAILSEVYNYMRPELSHNVEKSTLDALRVLYKRGMIEFHRNINGTLMFGIKTKQ